MNDIWSCFIYDLNQGKLIFLKALNSIKQQPVGRVMVFLSNPFVGAVSFIRLGQGNLAEQLRGKSLLRGGIDPGITHYHLTITSLISVVFLALNLIQFFLICKLPKVFQKISQIAK